MRGFRREYNNPQSCGPDNKWSGRVALLFDSTGKAFTGDWNYCSDSAALDLKATRWAGAWRAHGYTEAECGAASRYWCDSACRLAPCDAPLTQAQCLDFGRFWCNDACSLSQCTSSIRRVVKASPAQSRERVAKGLFDAQGRCLSPDGLSPGYLLQIP